MRLTCAHVDEMEWVRDRERERESEGGGERVIERGRKIRFVKCIGACIISFSMGWDFAAWAHGMVGALEQFQKINWNLNFAATFIQIEPLVVLFITKNESNSGLLKTSDTATLVICWQSKISTFSMDIEKELYTIRQLKCLLFNYECKCIWPCIEIIRIVSNSITMCNKLKLTQSN